MKWPDFAALLRAFAKALADAKANKPLPPPVAMTGPGIAATLKLLQSELPTIIAAIEAHPGLVRGADDILEALEAQGYVWAGEVEAGVNAAPGALVAVSAWLPEVLFALGAFAPVPTWHPGPTLNNPR